MGRGLPFNLKGVKEVSFRPLEVLDAFSGARSVSDKDSGYHHPEIPQEGGGMWYQSGAAVLWAGEVKGRAAELREQSVQWTPFLEGESPRM